MVNLRLLFSDEFLRCSEVEVAKVGGIHDFGVGAEGVLSTVKEKVTVGGRRLVVEITHYVLRETVAPPDHKSIAPIVGPRLLDGRRAGEGQNTTDAL